MRRRLIIFSRGSGPFLMCSCHFCSSRLVGGWLSTLLMATVRRFACFAQAKHLTFPTPRLLFLPVIHWKILRLFAHTVGSTQNFAGVERET